MKLSEQQEEEVRVAWNEKYPNRRVSVEQWQWWAIDEIENSSEMHFRLGFITAKGWDKEGK
jgi:hypothetical protein